MNQRTITAYADLRPVADDATGPDILTLTAPVEGFEPGTYRYARAWSFTTGHLADYADWLAQIDAYGAGVRVITHHGIAPYALGPAACALALATLREAWVVAAQDEDSASLTDCWLDALALGAHNGLVRVT